MGDNSSAMDRLLKFKERTTTKGDFLIVHSFPDKIGKLEDLITSAEWNISSSDITEEIQVSVPNPIMVDGINENLHNNKKRKIEDTNGTKVFIFPDGTVPCNSKVLRLSNVVKPFIKELVDDTNLLKMWLSLKIPKIEDGNNFGVSVQEDTLAEIQTVEAESSISFDHISRYFVSRAKLITKIAKYPHIADYRQSVRELDERQYINLRLILREIQNRYTMLHDIVTKNLDKLKKPRNCNSEALY